MGADWDDVVVGAGSAGCCVARRLAEAGRRVLLLEAGPGLPAPPAVTGPDFFAALRAPGWTWPGLWVNRHPDAGEVEYLRGRGVGGSSAVNGLVAMVGDADDYDRWDRLHGCRGRGWGWVRPGVARALQRLRLAQRDPGLLTAAVGASALAAGHPPGGTSTDAGRSGWMAAALTLSGGRRWSAADAYLTSPPTSLEVRAGTPVERVVLDGRRARGVQLEDGSVLAARRVVLAAGAVHTPVLLARSGVRPAGLGKGARDHPAVAFTVPLPARAPADLASPPISHLLRFSSGVGAPTTDLQVLPVERLGGDDAERPVGLVMVALMRVTSAGVLLDDSGNLAPRLDLLSTDLDTARLVAGVRHTLELLSSAPVAGISSPPMTPDGAPAEALAEADDDELAAWLPGRLGHYAHLGGGCRMGGDDDAERVVDLDGAVVGHDGLYVVDASVFPDLPAANLHLPVLAVAEQLAAGLVRRAAR